MSNVNKETASTLSMNLTMTESLSGTSSGSSSSSSSSTQQNSKHQDEIEEIQNDTNTKEEQEQEQENDNEDKGEEANESDEESTTSTSSSSSSSSSSEEEDDDDDDDDDDDSDDDSDDSDSDDSNNDSDSDDDNEKSDNAKKSTVKGSTKMITSPLRRKSPAPKSTLAPPGLRRTVSPATMGKAQLAGSYTLPAGSVALSESILKDLEKKGMGEVVAYHRGNTSERMIKSVSYPETTHLSSEMLFEIEEIDINNNNNDDGDSSNNDGPSSDDSSSDDSSNADIIVTDDEIYSDTDTDENSTNTQDPPKETSSKSSKSSKKAAKDKDKDKEKEKKSGHDRHKHHRHHSHHHKHHSHHSHHKHHSSSSGSSHHSSSGSSKSSHHSKKKHRTDQGASATGGAGLTVCEPRFVPTIPLLRTHLLKEGKLTDDAALRLIQGARTIFESEPNLLELEAPTVVCGDLHGQFYDMLTIFEIAGDLERINGRYLFLGDYVDRGSFSTEIVLYLCALKIRYPRKLYLLRGNHETRLMCEFMTFYDEVIHKYNRKIYDEFQRLFRALPLCAVIKNTSNGNCFCTHGGIGPEIRTLDDIRKINRFCEIPKKTGFWDLVWADPLPEWGDDTIQMTKDEWERSEFTPNSLRRSSYFYGLGAVEKFLRRNGLCCIIRGHQVQQSGYFEHFAHCDRVFPIAPVLTVFSAPNYCDEYENCAAFLQIMPDKFLMQQFFEVPHPYVLPEFVDALSWSLPFLLENIVSVLQQLVVGMIQDGDDDQDDLTPEERAADETLAKKTKALYAKFRRIKEQRDKFMEVNNHKNMSLFEKILKKDCENEACPPSQSRSLRRCTSEKTFSSVSLLE